MMKLDVVVPTYNRSKLMRAALESLLRAPVPDELEVAIYLVDNNSVDDTVQVFQDIQASANLPLHYVRAVKQGLSNARNAGIEAGSGEIIGFIDDDEQIDSEWFRVIAREFTNPEVQYIGGPYLANWEIDPPVWLPPGYPGVIGVVPPKPRGWYGEGHPGFLNGGNAVIRRTVFEAVGTYSPKLGRSANGLLSDEDAEFFRRLWLANIRGMYVPDLAIYHYIPADRLTRRYHRRWALWRMVSQGLLSREQPEAAPHLFGIPRHRIGRAVRSLFRLPVDRLASGGKGKAFADELAVWDLAGFIHGKYFFRPDSYYNDKAPKATAAAHPKNSGEGNSVKSGNEGIRKSSANEPANPGRR